MLAPSAPPPVRHSVRELDRRAAGRDLWPRDTLRWWNGEGLPGPAMVLWPETVEEVAAALAWAQREGVRVRPFGAGSGVCGAATGDAAAVSLDLKGLDRVGPLDEERWTVDVQAGVLGANLETWLAERGYTLGHSPSSMGCSTVGGWAAARSAGQFSSRYGVFEDMVLSLTAVSPSRGRFVVGEGGDAPDEWLSLLLGSEGRAAVITGVRLRVWPLPSTRWLRGFVFSGVAPAVRAMRRLMQGGLSPSVVRLYDPVDTRIGGKTRPKTSRAAGPSPIHRLRDAVARIPGASERLLALPLALPRLLNGLAELGSGDCLLVIGFEGDDDVVSAQVAAAMPILLGGGRLDGGRDLGAGPGERWYASRHAVSYKMMPVFEGGGFADTMEVAAPWSKVLPLYDAVRAALKPYALVMAHLSHVYPDGASLYFSFAGRGAISVYDDAWRAALDAVHAAGGTATHHHGVGRLKRRWASAEIGGARAGWEALCEALDPDDVLGGGALLTPPEATVPLPQVTEPAGRDGLVMRQVGTAASLRSGDEQAWPWRTLPGPARWTRTPWQTGWVTVWGEVSGVPVSLGRAPRSAAGPDLREPLVRASRGALATVIAASAGDRWLGRGRPASPWTVARALLRSDLRPDVLRVEHGELVVGFRGVAARAMGALASDRVPGGLVSSAWEARPLPGALRPCAADAPTVAWVTPQGFFEEVP